VSHYQGLKTVGAIGAVLISGIMLYAAFPPCDLSFLAWTALLPLFLALLYTGPLLGFLLSFLFGVAFYTGLFFWMFDLPKYQVLHHGVLGIYLCPLLGMVGGAFCFIAKRRGVAAALWSAPFLWIVQEYIRSNLSFLALPWGLLAHSQYQHPMLIQIGAITGVWGISFLIVLVNSAITAVACHFFKKSNAIGKTTAASLSKPKMIAIFTTGGVLLCLTLFYGYLTISKTIAGEKIEISVIQANIDQSRKWDPEFADEIMEIYTNLTRRGSEDKPALIVWPETATPKSINMDPKLRQRIKNMAQSAGCHIVLGSSQLQKFKVDEPKSAKYFNSAFLISPEKEQTKNQRYDKLRLLPFSEYLPYKDKIPWALINIPDVGSYLPGKKHTIFQLASHRFGVTICWENIFPDIARAFVKNGAQFLVNITNEGRFGRTATPYQFLSMSVFRAVENRVFVVRCANTGISCFIDPYGRISDRVRDKDGRDVFVRGILTRSIIPLDSRTLYLQFGDWPVWLCMLVSIGLLVLAAIRKDPHTGLNAAADTMRSSHDSS